MVCHSFPQWTTVFQNSPPWPVHLGWANTAWAIVSEAQAGIKIAGRNINNLRYADDTTLTAEREEELKSLLMKVKEESETVGLKLNIQEMKIMASGLITSWQIDGEKNGNTERLHFGGHQNHFSWWLHLWNKMTFAPWKKSCDQAR